MRTIVTLALLALASPGLAESAPTDADLAAVAGALEKQGCEIAAIDADAILADSGLAREAADAAMAKLAAEGWVIAKGEGATLRTAKCIDEAAASGLPPVPDRAAFVVLVERRGCVLEFAEAEQVLSEAGFTPATVNPVFEALIAEGAGEMSETAFTLRTGTCK